MIKITDRFYITANTNCYTLTEKTTVKDTESKNYGQEMFKDVGYYSTLENCLNGILKTVIREFISSEDINSVYELKEQIKLTTDFLKSLNLKF